ncbi:hypothetical protein LTS08_002027 [Lithohypha guttulata]|nr:hypothetical protein LTS08_002027 [Lithohypha guttulata]
MPPRIHLQSFARPSSSPSSSRFVCVQCRHATAAATVPAPTESQILNSAPSTQRYSQITPPSHRDPAYRKSQLLRTYVSLLQTTPLIILFQHNNLKALEWASIRRELANALQKVDETQLKDRGPEAYIPISDSIKLTVIRTNMFEPALRITEYYKPTVVKGMPVPAQPHGIEDERLDPSLTHTLSRAAHDIAAKHRNQHPLTPLLTGPLAVLTFPTVSPQHVRAALSILAPQAPIFPAPTRRANPGYHEPATQEGLKKLMMLGARIDGQVFDTEGVRWVGGIEGGIDGLRAQLVGMLQGFGAGITTTLEAASRNLWLTVEGRRRMLEEQSAPKKEEAGAEVVGGESTGEKAT